MNALEIKIVSPEERRARLARMSGAKSTPALPAPPPLHVAAEDPSRPVGPMPCGLPMWYFVVPHVEYDITDAGAERVEPRLAWIMQCVAAYFRLGKNDLLSRRRHHNVVMPRQVAFYLCKELTRKSLPEIGRRFGMDHTTVLSAVRKIARLIPRDSGLANDVATLIHAITGRYQ